jgi:hypothetical protein
MEQASKTWHPLNGAPLVAQVWAGTEFKDGEPVTKPNPQTTENQPESDTPIHKI